MTVLKAIGKQQIEKKSAPNNAVQFVKGKTREEIRQAVKLENKIKNILQTMPGRAYVLPKQIKAIVPQAKKVNQVVKPGLKALKLDDKLIASLTRKQRKGLLSNLSVTKSQRGKIIGVNYDYTSNKNRNFIRVNLTNDMMVVHTRQLVTQVTTTSSLVGTKLYEVLVNPTQSLGGEREKRFSSCFDKYDITDCRFEYNPASATTVSGNMFGGFDFDPTQYYPPSTDGLEKLLTKPLSHDCMFYGGGKAEQYVWQMPRYPGKKPTFFIDETDKTGSGIRFANEAQFLLLTGFGVKDAELGVMGSLWCEMTTKFYDPYIQNIEGTKSSFYWSPTVPQVAWGTQDDQQMTSVLKVAASDNTAGVEYVPTMPILGEVGYYVPPGVWTVDLFLNGTSSVVAYSGASWKAAGFTLSWWNATQTDWKVMAGSNNLPLGNAAYLLAPSFIQGQQTDSKIDYAANQTLGSGKFVIPNDGLDYYITLVNQTSVYDQTPAVVYEQWLINNDGAAAVPTTLTFHWHAANAYDAPFLSPSANLVLVDRIKTLEAKFANLEKLDGVGSVKLIREEKDGKARKMESTIKVAAVLPDLYDNEDDEEEKPHTPLKQEQKFVRVDPPPVAQVVVRDGKESFLYKEGDGLRKCDPPPGAWVFCSKKRDGVFGPMIWKRVIDGDYIRWVCVLDVTTAPSSLYNDLVESLVDYETEKNFGSGYINRPITDILNNEPLVKRGKSVSLK